MARSRFEGRPPAPVGPEAELSDQERTDRITHAVQPSSEPNSPLGAVERVGRVAAGLRRMKSDERPLVRILAIALALAMLAAVLAGPLSDILVTIP
jgi:hypothetical protein